MTPLLLFDLYNKWGFTKLELSGQYENGSWSKWVLFSELMQKENVDWDFYTNRSIMDIEIVLDYDTYKCIGCNIYISNLKCSLCGYKNTTENKKKGIIAHFNKRLKELRHQSYRYNAYYTGGNGFHIHLLFPELRSISKQARISYKREFIRRFGGEELKASERVMILREGAKNRKYPRHKTLISCKNGTNPL